MLRRRAPRRAVLIDPLHEIVERRCPGERIAVIDDCHDDEAAEKVLSAATRDSRTAAAAYFYLGRIANRQGQYPEALRDLDRAVRLRPDYADALAEVGIIRLKRRQYAAS